VPAIGIARTFQNVALFDRQTVRWNVRAGLYCHLARFQFRSLLHTRSWRHAARDADDAVDELLRRTHLLGVADRPVSELPFGTRKRVELARALAMKPKLLLLDEPAAGLNYEEVGELESWIRDIRDALGVAVLLIEHHMNLVMRTSDHVVVLDFGVKIADGTPSQVASEPQVQTAYLGAPA
jgi:branched-chain amino acid transport system ATP-binding protein